MVTHDMRLVAEHADWVVVLAEGRSVYEGDLAGLFSQPGLVGSAGLAVPALGQVCAELHERAGTPPGLYTVAAFLAAAGMPRDPGIGSSRPRGGG
jgi:ABC-type dipeptide/oligopeptide/nickel transport system ATPase component